MNYIISTLNKTVIVDFMRYFREMGCCHMEIYGYGHMSALSVDTEVFMDTDMDRKHGVLVLAVVLLGSEAVSFNTSRPVLKHGSISLELML